MNAKRLIQKVLGVGVLVAVTLAVAAVPIMAISTLSADEAAGLIFIR